MNVAEVFVDLAVQTVDRPFSYLVPDHLQVAPGQAVQVPFGARQVPGLVVGFTDCPPEVELKPIARVLLGGDPVLTKEQVQLAFLLSEYYLCPVSLMLRQLIPFRLSLDPKRWPRPKLFLLVVPQVDRFPEDLPARASKQRELLRQLLADGPLPLSEVSRSAAKQLEQRGLVSIQQVSEQRSPRVAQVAAGQGPVNLTEQQQSVLQSLIAGRQSPGSTWLLHGVTGSGKTEIYLQLIAQVLQSGQQALMLVPEIALTPQMVQRFSARFGSRIAVWHSGLSRGERHDEWHRVKNGAAGVVIGARSAVFLPFKDLGLIVMDEEHEGSYRQDENPRYHARVVAQFWQRLTGCQLVLGSATPSLETYFASEQGRCQRLCLPQRISHLGLPPVRLVDMRDEYRAGHRSPISRRLQRAVAECLERGEQALILLNRRGFAHFLLCPDCGHVPFCPHCDISLTYHLSDRRLHCHYCGHSSAVPALCPECETGRLQSQGVGTEQLQSLLQTLFPQASVGRMDRDTTGRRDSHASLLAAFSRGEYDLLVGTQMIAKGLDFPRVTLVGVVNADAGLYVPEFRSAERTFQLLTQVAGRAGRASHPGEVVIQTFRPEHYVLRHAQQHDYLEFYRHELGLRSRTGYPPVGYMVTLLLTNQSEGQLIADAAALRVRLAQRLPQTVELIGPTPCGVSRIKDTHRWQIILRSRQRVQLRKGLWAALNDYYAENRKTGVVLDFEA
ncbi:MAG: replication restart helicase PriA [Bacillota bacterium]|jgi:primosomal protein N' (replication factor Y)